jgi:hypothetical protein
MPKYDYTACPAQTSATVDRICSNCTECGVDYEVRSTYVNYSIYIAVSEHTNRDDHWEPIVSIVRVVTNVFGSCQLYGMCSLAV